MEVLTLLTMVSTVLAVLGAVAVRFGVDVEVRFGVKVEFRQRLSPSPSSLPGAAHRAMHLAR